MAKKKRKRTAYQKACDRIETEGRRQCFIIYGASAIALWRHYSKRQQAITRLFDITSEVWHECAATNMHSMIEMCEQETGIEVQNGNGKSWEELPYMNATLDTGRMSYAQWIYMRRQQIKWIAPQVMACIMIALHRKYGFGFDRLSRFYGQVDEVRAEYGGDADRIREECRQLTGIDVADTTTERRRQKLFDFISYVRDSGLQLRILPPADGILIHLELRDPDTGYFERHAITDSEAGRCSNIDTYTGQVLDGMAARIGQKKARLYADRFKSQKRRAIEELIRECES